MSHPKNLRSLDDVAPVILVGCGRMGTALLSGWLAGGLPPRSVRVVEPHPSADLLDLASRNGFEVVPEATAGDAGTVVLAVKPQSLPTVAQACLVLFENGAAIVSIMAGIGIDAMAALFPKARSVTRTMPNLAAMAGAGATVLVSGRDCPAADRDVAERLMAAVGVTEWLPDEGMMDAAVGVSGSGPAYAFLLCECLARAGAAEGLPVDVAERLARATLVGAGAVLALREDGPDELRRQVSSPGGTTEAGIAVLAREPGLDRLVRDTVAAAAARSRELGAAG